MLLSLRDRGVNAAKLAVGDGALGFWSALVEVYPSTRMQRRWVHKTTNLLAKLPKCQHSAAKSMLYEVWQADTKKSADQALNRFYDTYEAKYPKAADCLARDRETLLAFYDFPARLTMSAHKRWRRLRGFGQLVEHLPSPSNLGIGTQTEKGSSGVRKVGRGDSTYSGQKGLLAEWP